MKVGEKIRVEAYKADGTCYRWWETVVEEYSPALIVTISPAGEPVNDLKRGTWGLKHVLRSYYWFDKPYNLIEVFEPDGRLIQIYINVGSLPWVEKGILCFTDHELDVLAVLPAQAIIVDEDEFAEATVEYGYTQEFQQEMRQVAQHALEIADHWEAKAPPNFGGEHAE